MSKKKEYFEHCQELFVVQGYSITRIAQEVDVSEKTLHQWSDYGDWKEKRVECQARNQSLKEVLGEIKNKLATRILDKLKKDELDPQELYGLTRLIGATTGKKYIDDDQEKNKSDGRTKEESLAQAIQDIYGVNLPGQSTEL